MQTFAADNLKYVYSPAHEPIGSVQPGERFIVDTSDCFTGRYRDPADFSPESAAWVDANLNPVTGPICVDGAQPGNAIEVHIESITVTTPAAVVISERIVCLSNPVSREIARTLIPSSIIARAFAAISGSV